MALRLPTLDTRITKILRWCGYPLFYVFCLMVFARLTFPYERIKNRIIAEFDARQTGPERKRLEIEEVSGHWFTGVEAEGVRLITTPRESKPGSDEPDKTQEKASVLSIDSLYGSVSLLRLIFGTLSVDFGAELGEGEIDGNLVRSSELSKLEVQLQDVSVAGLAPLEEIVELPLGGTLAGSIDFEMPEGELAQSHGNIQLTIEDLEIGDGKAKIRNTIALPKLRAGSLELVAEAEEGKLELKSFSANGPDFQLKSTGSLRLRDPFNSSIADLRVTFKFKDGYKNKNDITRGLFGAPDSKVPGLFDLDPKIKRAKGNDGSYGWRVSGQVAKMNFAPAADGTPGARRLGSTSRTRPKSKNPKSKKK